jgi:YD repeat-containing protein
LNFPESNNRDRGKRARLRLFSWGDIYDQGPSARKISYAYGADGLLNTETLEPDKAATDPAKQTTTYTYDAFGNRRTATVSGAGLTAARTTTTDYGPDGQFPLRVVNPAGHVETAVFDARFGVPSRVTDADGHETLMGYDVRGRRTLLRIWPNITSLK